MTLSMMGMGMMILMMMDSECKEKARWNGKRSLEKSKVEWG